VVLAISDGEAIDELIAFFTSRECSVRRLAADTIEVEAHPTLTAARARMELDLLLRVWQEMRPRYGCGSSTSRPRSARIASCTALAAGAPSGPLEQEELAQAVGHEATGIRGCLAFGG
jgi:hypothetical protein